MNSLLFCHYPEHTKQYRREFAPFGLEIDVFREAAQIAEEPFLSRPYSLFLLDLTSSIRAASQDKHLLHELEAIYPTARLRLSPSDNSLRFSFNGPGYKTITEFLAFCLRRPARKRRVHPRYDIHLSIVVDDAQGHHHELTTTLNLSQMGCFIFSANRYEVGERLQLSFPDSPLPLPRLNAVVRWQMPWGSHGRLPGIGVEFIQPPSDLIALVRQLPRHEGG